MRERPQDPTIKIPEKWIQGSDGLRWLEGIDAMSSSLGSFVALASLFGR
jgi:hypothetical protein